MAPAFPANLMTLLAAALGLICVVMLVKWLRSWPLEGLTRRLLAIIVGGALAMVAWLAYALAAGDWGLGITVFVVSLGVTPFLFTAGVIAFILRSTRDKPDGALLMWLAGLAAVLTYALD
jgi:uncharacterized membrane protein